MRESAGKRLHQALQEESPLQIIGTVNAYVALMAKELNFRAIYLSGAGVANASYGVPDVGITTLENVLEDVRRITSAVDLPLLVDIDTGWGSPSMIQKTIREMIRAGAAGVHMEDQVSAKRCGHLAGKGIVSTEEMVARIQAAVEAKTDPAFVIMARTDAFANEGMEGAIKRAKAYTAAGADMLFPEALHQLSEYRTFCDAVNVPVLSNLTEFGKTPLFTLQELRGVGVDMALYPLSAMRAMNQAAFHVMKILREEGTQKNCLEMMQTREELYRILNYVVQK